MPGGPKKVSAQVLRGRGSPLAVAREKEEQRAQGRYAEPVPVVRPLPRTLSRVARDWGKALMAAYIFDELEHRLLVEFLAVWDAIRTLTRDVQDHGYSQTDKNGISRQRPEARMLEHARQTFLSYAKQLAIKICPNAPPCRTAAPAPLGAARALLSHQGQTLALLPRERLCQ